MKQNLKNLMLLSTAFLLGGCMVGPDYKSPESEVLSYDLDKENFHRDNGMWKTATPTESLPKGDWWSVYKDEQLSDLLTACKENNPNLKAAFYRVEQLRQSARLDSSELYPQVGGSAVYETNHGSKNNLESSSYPNYDNWTTGVGMTWDLDLFGRIRSILRADIADAQAAADSYNSLILSMQSQIAKTYFTICQYNSEIELLKETLAERKKQTDLIRKMLEFDSATQLDLQRAIEQEAEAQAQLAAVKTMLDVSKNNIAILIGTTPSRLVIEEKLLADKLPTLPRAVPSELLERRPDISAAERKVFAANARIGAAQAGFFPTVSISAEAGLSANKIDKLLDSSSFAWGVSPQVYIPIFQAGRIYAQKQVALAYHKETLETYKATVLNAIGEVENAMSSIANLEQEYLKRSEVCTASARVFELTNFQFKHGEVDYFSVSEASRLSLLNQREQIRIKSSRFLATVDFITSLGGGWTLPHSELSSEEIMPSMYEGINEDS